MNLRYTKITSYKRQHKKKEIMQTPSKLLKEQRSKANLTQEGLSEKSGIPVRLISSWERGLSHPNYNNLKKLKKAFSCTYEDLFDGTAEDLERGMSKVEKLLLELNELQELTKDYNTFGDLFSDDESIRTLAKIRQCAGQIELHAEFTKFKEISHPEGRPFKETNRTGAYVKVRPCADEFKDKTYLGIMVGDAALSSSVSIKEETIVCSWRMFNPLILIPELKILVTGSASWWGIINTPEDLESITDNNIDNVWYVQALKSLAKGKE